jgi:hypothetical protein
MDGDSRMMSKDYAKDEKLRPGNGEEAAAVSALRLKMARGKYLRTGLGVGGQNIIFHRTNELTDSRAVAACPRVNPRHSLENQQRQTADFSPDADRCIQ